MAFAIATSGLRCAWATSPRSRPRSTSKNSGDSSIVRRRNIPMTVNSALSTNGMRHP